MRKNEYINSYCTGCGLCHSIKGTEMKIIDRGFPNAVVSENEDVAFCEKVCPVFYYSEESIHDVWGKVDKALVAYSSDDEIRFHSASGGALTELCVYLLDQKLVDAIIHTTFDPADQTKTVSCISKTPEEVVSRCGSRYSISVPLENIEQMVETGKKYAFVGKPCDAMALKRYMTINPQIRETIPYVLSFFCAGEPSVNAQDQLLNKMGCTHEECSRITYRGNGWPGYTTVVKKDGTTSKLEYKIAWGSYLGRDLRNICRFCMDGTGDCADIVCADFWHLDSNGNPEFTEHEGRNIIITRNERATEIVMGAVEKGRLICESDFTTQMDEFYKYQPHQYKRKTTMKSTIFAMKLCGKPTPKYSHSYLNRYAKHANLKVKAKYFWGIVKRVIKGKL